MILQGKVAIVTGGGSGMGRAVCLRFAREGASVVVGEWNAESGAAVVEEIVSGGGEAAFVRCDVSRTADVENLVAECVALYGGVDVVYANAGIELIGEDARAHELTEEIWDKIMAVNLKGIWLTCKYALIEMVKAKAGSIIIAASPTGLFGIGVGETAYSSSKGGVAGLTRVMAADYAREGIRINAVVPGAMDTPMNDKYFASVVSREQVADSIPMGRIGRADEIVGLVTFLASDEASYCTGGFYMADGGLTAV